MWVKSLQVIDYRNYQAGEVEFFPGPNVLVGANGQGKTNLVEAVGYLATLSSHRVASDAFLIRKGADRAVVRGSVVNDGRELLIELEITAGKANRARINRAPVSRTRDVVGILRTVLFAPEDLGLVRGDPGERRRFLDELLITRTPRYAGVRQDYDRVLKQRNALLKTAGFARRAGKDGDLRTLEVWDGHLARAGAELLVGRLRLVADLRPHLEQAYTSVSAAAEVVGMTYRASASESASEGEPDGSDDSDGSTGSVQWEAGEVPSVAAAEAVLLSALDRVRKAEVDRGVTLVGPHRDELVLNIDGQLAKGYASHGQSWSIALALRLASYELLRSEGSEPVLILDDVFAELDVRRREHLATLALGAEQSLITAAVGADVPDILGARKFTVTSGQIKPATDEPGSQ